MTIRAATYARYSSDGQRDMSIDAQLREIEKYAKQNNYTIVETYTDKAMTGTNADRDSFQKMIDDL